MGTAHRGMLQPAVCRQLTAHLMHVPRSSWPGWTVDVNSLWMSCMQQSKSTGDCSPAGQTRTRHPPVSQKMLVSPVIGLQKTLSTTELHAACHIHTIGSLSFPAGCSGQGICHTAMVGLSATRANNKAPGTVCWGLCAAIHKHGQLRFASSTGRASAVYLQVGFNASLAGTSRESGTLHVKCCGLSCSPCCELTALLQTHVLSLSAARRLAEDCFTGIAQQNLCVMR